MTALWPFKRLPDVVTLVTMYDFDVLVHRALGRPGRVEGRLSVWLNVQHDLHRLSG